MIYTDGKRSCWSDGNPIESGNLARYRVYEVKLGSDPSENEPLLHKIDFQPAPIPEVGVIGVTNECLLAIVEDRLRCFQAGPFPCEENAIAREHVIEALKQLTKRTEDRERRGVEGKHVA